MRDGVLIHTQADVEGSVTAAEASERAFRPEETVPMRRDRGEAEIAAEAATATDLEDAQAVEVGGEVRPFVSEETVPLRDDRERQEAEERDARLALILPPRRRLRPW